MLYRLIFLSGKLKGQRITVDDSQPMTIGRDPDCTINIHDSEAASKHAVLEHKALTGLSVNDLGSMNRILLNNHEVRSANLKHGDIVEIGRTRFLVQASVETDPTKNAPKARMRHISLTPLFIIIPLFVVIYAVVSFCQKIIRESTRVTPVPVAISVISSNSSPTQAVARLTPPKLAEKSTNSPTPTEVLKPISDEIRQMQEDMRGLKQTVKDLAVKPLPPSNVVTVASVQPKINVQPRTEPQPATRPAVLPPVILSTDNVPPPVAATGPQPPRVVPPADPQFKINFLEQQKFQENEDVDELRIITIGISRDLPAKSIKDDSVRVDVAFFDLSADGTSFVPTKAVVQKPKSPDQWQQDTQAVVTAIYSVPKGSRKSSRPNTPVEQFYGYVVRVFYRDKLQDEDARPKTLLNYSTGTTRKQNATAGISQAEKK